jgi:hypothetical protein
MVATAVILRYRHIISRDLFLKHKKELEDKEWIYIETSINKSDSVTCKGDCDGEDCTCSEHEGRSIHFLQYFQCCYDTEDNVNTFFVGIDVKEYYR